MRLQRCSLAPAALVLLASGIACQSLQGEPVLASGSPRWLINSEALSQIYTLDAPLATYYFDTSPTDVSGTPRAGWTSVPTTGYKSFADFANAVAAKTVPGITRVVMYDNEAWGFTPLTEQDDPAYYEQRFATLAHANGYLAVMAPALDLVTVQSWYDPHKSRTSQYLSHGFASFSAHYADGIDVQAQSLEANASGYASFVGAAATQARAVHPGVVVLAGLSTGPSGQSVTGLQLYQATQGSRSAIDGYWLNVPGQSLYCQQCLAPAPQVAVDYLKLLKAGS